MKKVHEYREHAAECRALASAMSDENHREQLLKMAAIWEGMAQERERIVQDYETVTFAPKPSKGWP